MAKYNDLFFYMVVMRKRLEGKLETPSRNNAAIIGGAEEVGQASPLDPDTQLW